MPYFKVTTNNSYSGNKESFLKATTTFVSELLNKPEKYVMVELSDKSHILFGSNNQPLAYVELKSIGLPTEKTKAFSADICAFITEHFNVDKSRIYIEFSDVERNKWGWNGSTFA